MKYDGPPLTPTKVVTTPIVPVGGPAGSSNPLPPSALNAIAHSEPAPEPPTPQSIANTPKD